MAETWSKIIEAHGIKIQLYTQTRGASVYRELRTPNGKNRKSLRTSDRDEAEEIAKRLAAEIAKNRLTGVTPETLTLEQLHRIYVRERGRLLSDRRKIAVRRSFRLLRGHLGDEFRIADLGEHQCETYEAARRAGRLCATWGSNGGGSVSASAIAAELDVLHAALNGATGFKRNGKPLIDHNPIRGVARPTNPNKARPVASRERFEKMVDVADQIDSTGGFRTMLTTAWYTGRRFSSIAALRASDVLLTPDQVERALAASRAARSTWPSNGPQRSAGRARATTRASNGSFRSPRFSVPRNGGRRLARSVGATECLSACGRRDDSGRDGTGMS